MNFLFSTIEHLLLLRKEDFCNIDDKEGTISFVLISVKFLYIFLNSLITACEAFNQKL